MSDDGRKSGKRGLETENEKIMIMGVVGWMDRWWVVDDDEDGME